MDNQKKPDRKHEAFQALKFTLFSISAGIVQIVSYTLFYEAFHWAPWVSYLVSLILSVLWNFTFNRKYTFRSDADIPEIHDCWWRCYYLVFTPVSTWWTAALTGENPLHWGGGLSEPLVDHYDCYGLHHADQLHHGVPVSEVRGVPGLHRYQ